MSTVIDSFDFAAGERPTGRMSLPKEAVLRDRSPVYTAASGLPLAWIDGKPLETPSIRTTSGGSVKRLIDVSLSTIALIVLLPLLVFVAAAIKLSGPGPVLFRQAREGIDGTHFDLFKFRSMRLDEGDPSGVKQTAKDDPRCTPIGRFIRRTSIDELPQLFNVIRGEMSLVGPRPHVPGMLAAGVHYRALVPFYDLRLKVRPGLTGWAQANGWRGPTTDAEAALARIEHDVAYVQNASVWLDCKIIVKTIRTELFGGTGS